jgi:hypothetical protein
LFWCTILCSLQNESRDLAAYVATVPATQPASAAKVVVNQVIGSKDIVPFEAPCTYFKPRGKSRFNLRKSKHEKSFFAVGLVRVYGSPSFAQMWD